MIQIDFNPKETGWFSEKFFDYIEQNTRDKAMSFAMFVEAHYYKFSNCDGNFLQDIAFERYVKITDMNECDAIKCVDETEVLMAVSNGQIESFGLVDIYQEFDNKFGDEFE